MEATGYGVLVAASHVLTGSRPAWMMPGSASELRQRRPAVPAALLRFGSSPLLEEGTDCFQGRRPALTILFEGAMMLLGFGTV
jgi:hypothetical protein